MSSGISPQRLLGQAQTLAGIGAGRGRPSPTDLRRAASGGYYALFHSITRNIAQRMLPDQPEAEWLLLTRSISHVAIAEVSNMVLSAGGPQHLRMIMSRAKADTDLYQMADTFVQAQQLRHAADYDHLARINKAAVVDQLKSIGTVLSFMEQLWGRPSFDAFGAAVLPKSSPK